MAESETPKNNKPVLNHEELRARLPYPAVGLLPHGEPFALIDTIVDEWDQGGKTSSVVHPDHPLAGADGATGAETFIEYAAQTAAVLDALAGDIPVIAAVKSRRDIPFLNAVRAAPLAEVFFLTQENREALYRQLLPRMKSL